MRRRCLLWSAVVLTLTTTSAQAHIRLISPVSRYGDGQKAGPCGLDGGTRTSNVTNYLPGQTVTIEWQEIINHPSHYRISFDDDGVDDLIDPTDFMDFDVAPSVLLDNILDGGSPYALDITLPNLECQNCTLQLIQVMYDKPPWGPLGGNDIYYQCADLTLGPDPGPVDPGASGCRVAVGGRKNGPAAGVLLAFVTLLAGRSLARAHAKVMLLARLLVLTAALLLSLASGTAGAPAENVGNSREIKGDDVVGWRITLDGSTPLVHALGIGAARADCQVQRPQKNRLIARCKGGVLAIIQEDRELLIGCEKVVLDQCREIFQKIMDHTPRSR